MDEKTKFYEMSMLLYLDQRKYFDALGVYHILSQVGSNRTEHVVLSSFLCILATSDTEISNIADKRKEMLRKLSEDKNKDEVARSIVNKFMSHLVLEKSILGNIQKAFSSVLDTSIYLYDLIAVVDEHSFRVIKRFYSSITI